MTFDLYEKKFRELAGKAGYSEDNIVKCLSYAKPLIERNIPVLYNTANLAAYVGYKKSYIKKAVLFPTYFYRTFSIKKANGGSRILREPLPSLKEIQNWILENILREIPISKYAKAYVKHRNIIDNVRFHRNKDYVLKLDLKDFFGSIFRPQIESFFLSLGYSSNVSNLLSKLCCCDDSLPQGAPTSPALSNIYMHQFDETVASYCKERKIRYSRYADDLTFSTNGNEPDVFDFVKNELEKLKLSINEKKTRLAGRNQQQIVTGVITNKVIQLPKTQRDKIRQEVYYVIKHGLEKHLVSIKCEKKNYLEHLLGKINYALFLNPKDIQLQKYRVQIALIIKSKKNQTESQN